jgi:hypothetical protein
MLFVMASFAPAAVAQQGRTTPGVAQENLFLLDNSPRTAAVSQSDLAFWGDRAYVGYYDGFRILDISNPRKMRQLADVSCRNNQGDVSIWEDLLIVSIDRPVTAPDCTGVDTPGNVAGWEGIRIFDVSDPATVGPDSLVAAVGTDCGSHTNTLVPDLDNNRVLVYVSSLATDHGPSLEFGIECHRTDPDIFPLETPPARTLAHIREIQFSHSVGDLDMRLADPTDGGTEPHEENPRIHRSGMR